MTRRNSLRLVRVAGWTLTVAGGLVIVGPGLASDPEVSLVWLDRGAGMFFPGVFTILATVRWRNPAG